MILVDTNIVVAVANDQDSHHQTARRLLETLPDELLVPPTVIAEICYLLNERAGASAIARMAELCDQYADLGLGGTDASLVAIAERLGIDRIATLDRRHFSVVRPRHAEALVLLPA